MKTFMLLCVLSFATIAAAGEKSYQSGTLQEMTAVDCGFEEKSSQSLVGEVLGTDSAAHSKTRKMLCHQYLLKAANVMYRIRPRSEEKHPPLLPVGERALFRLKKDRMVLRMPEGDDKERDYDIVSMEPVEKNATTAQAQAKK